MAFLDDIVNKAQQAGNFVVAKTESAVDYVSLEYKASTVRGKLDKQYKELGQLVYKSRETALNESEEIKAVIENISKTLTELNEINAQINKSKNACEKCGNINRAKAEYCEKCGNPLK